jgi:hypothetical protein
MSILKKKLHNLIPIWVIAVVCIGTAAGAYVWISNSLTTIVDVQDPPIELSGSFETPVYLDIGSVSNISYVINDVSKCHGYIQLQFIAPVSTLVGDEIYATVDLYPEGVYYSTSINHMEYYSNSLIFVFESGSHDQIDFSDSGLASSGFMLVYIEYHESLLWMVSIAISETPM